MPPDTAATSPRLLDRARHAAQAEIAVVAMDLFLSQGFEATTIDQIVQAAGISRRSFFRYFGTKEDVVLRPFVSLGPVLAATLEQRPADESPWEALRGALEVLATDAMLSRRSLAVSRLIAETPSLRAWHLDKHRQWQDLLVPVLEKRLGMASGPVPDVRAHAIVGAALTCLDTATELWTRSDGAISLGDAYDAAVAAVRT